VIGRAAEIIGGLFGEAVQRRAVGLSLDDAAERAIDKERVIDRPGGGAELAHGHAGRRTQVHVAAVLDEPAARLQLGVDRRPRLVFGMKCQRHAGYFIEYRSMHSTFSLDAANVHDMFRSIEAGGLDVHLVHNERTKLTAMWFNTLATAFVAAGLFAPLAAVIYGLTEPRIGPAYIIVTALSCVLGGWFIHWIGRRFLGRLRE